MSMTTMTKAERDAAREYVKKRLNYANVTGVELGASVGMLDRALDALDAADKPVEDAEVARWISTLRARGADSYDTWQAADLIERLHRQLAAAKALVRDANEGRRIAGEEHDEELDAKERETAEKCAATADATFGGPGAALAIRRAFNLGETGK